MALGFLPPGGVTMPEAVPGGPSPAGGGGGLPLPPGPLVGNPPPVAGPQPFGGVPQMPGAGMASPFGGMAGPIDPSGMKYDTETQADGTILLYIKNPDGSRGPAVKIVPNPVKGAGRR